MIACGVTQEHRGLFPDLICEAHTRGDHEFLVDGAKTFSQPMPLLPGEDGPEVGDRHIVSIHRVGDGGRDGASKVNAELVTEEIEVDPSLSRATLDTPEQLSVESPGLVEIVNGDGEMKRDQGRFSLHHSSTPRVMQVSELSISRGSGAVPNQESM